MPRQTAVQTAGTTKKRKNKINYEVNRIHKEIAESPYKVRDLGIQVMVEPPNPKMPLPYQHRDRLIYRRF